MGILVLYCSNLKKPNSIYGDGCQVRDVLFIDDLFEAWDSATEKINDISGEVFNVGGGPQNTLSLLELIAMLKIYKNEGSNHLFRNGVQVINLYMSPTFPRCKVSLGGSRRPSHLKG